MRHQPLTNPLFVPSVAATGPSTSVAEKQASTTNNVQLADANLTTPEISESSGSHPWWPDLTERSRPPRLTQHIMSDSDRRFNTKDKDEMSKGELWEEIDLYFENATDGLEELESLIQTQPADAPDDSATAEQNTDIQISSTKAIEHLKVIQELHHEYRNR